MDFAATTLLAFAMSADAFAAAIGKGAVLHKPRFVEALRMGAIFGVVEMITPVIGWTLGVAASKYVAAWDHWIAFALLCGLGSMMVRGGLKSEADPINAPTRHSFLTLALTAIATSIDAAAVGVGLAFMKADIVTTALAIGLATMIMVTIGVTLGRILGKVAGKRAEVAGGLILIGIGVTILYEHLGA